MTSEWPHSKHSKNEWPHSVPETQTRAVETGDPQAKVDRRNAFARGLDDAMQSAYTRLKRTQARYKRNFDSRVRRANKHIRPGDYVFVDPSDGTTKGTKLGNHALGPFRVLKNDERTVTRSLSASTATASRMPVAARGSTAGASRGDRGRHRQECRGSHLRGGPGPSTPRCSER